LKQKNCHSLPRSLDSLVGANHRRSMVSSTMSLSITWPM
jgi:hypothetical protein